MDRNRSRPRQDPVLVSRTLSTPDVDRTKPTRHNIFSKDAQPPTLDNMLEGGDQRWSKHTYYALEAHFSYDLTGGDESIVPFLDAVTEHLRELGVEDVFVVSDEAAHEFTTSQLITSTAGESIETVVGKGMGALRTAFHTCQGQTPGWPATREALLSVSVSPVQVVGEVDEAARDKAIDPLLPTLA